MSDDEVEARAIVRRWFAACSHAFARIRAAAAAAAVVVAAAAAASARAVETRRVPACGRHEDKVRWDDMMLSALEQQEAALLDSIHDLDKRLAAPRCGFVFRLHNPARLDPEVDAIT